MSPRAVLVSSALVASGVAFVAWFARWPLAKAVFFAPVLVVVVGIFAFWGLVAARSLRDASRPRQALIVTIGVLLILVIVQLILNRLGIVLPRETG